MKKELTLITPILRYDLEKLMQKRLAIMALGGSTYRAMPKDSRKATVRYLSSFELDDFRRTQDGDAMNKLVAKMSRDLHTKLRQLASKDARFGRGKRIIGSQWGYAAKAVNIFLFSVALNRLLLSGSDSKKLLPMLHCPLDKKLFVYLKKHGAWRRVSLRLNRVTSADYVEVQNVVRLRANLLRVMPIRIDDLSWTDSGGFD